MKPTPQLLGALSPLNHAGVERDRFGGRVSLYLAGVTHPGQEFPTEIEATPAFFAITGEVEAREPSTIPRPVCYLDDIAAQRLADSLYAAGFRPSEAMGSAGQREAIEAHLATVKGILDQTLPLALRRADE